MHNRSFLRFITSVLFLLVFSAGSALADELGSIRGTVTDTTGAVIAGAKLTATDVQTGIAQTTESKADGSYAFLQIHTPGTYKVSAAQNGFKAFETSAISLSLNQIYVLNIGLEVGALTQQVTVEASPVQVETTSIQLGGEINSATITEIPLNGRNWVTLQQSLPGVVASSDRFGTNFSTNGARTQANGYMINGTDANDLPLNTPLEIPSPDAIAEVHVITNTINPEYGRNSGAILNATIKPGTNQFHGDGFEFYRDTSLNTRSFFQLTPTIFHQNQFGGTIGGPIVRDKAFFFFSYQGTKARSPQAGGNVSVFSAAQRAGTFAAGDFDCFVNTAGGGTPANSCNHSPVPLVGDSQSTCPAIACAAGALYGNAYDKATGALLGTGLFHTGGIPAADMSSISTGLISKYVPTANAPNNQFVFNPITTQKTNQEIFRVDEKLRDNDSIYGYGYFSRSPSVDTLPFTGSTLPGFPEQAKRNVYQYTLDWTHTFSGSTLNDFSAGYSRFNFVAVLPVSPVLPSSAGFTGITPQDPAGAGLPTIPITGYFTLGFSDNGPQPRIDQTYQVGDNLTKIMGEHTMKLGFQMRRAQVFNPFFFGNNGHFDFGGSGSFTTGDPAADFLLGFADDYFQSSGGIIDARTQEYYSYFQDQWKFRKNLTLTYGVSWQLDTPLTDIFNKSVAINGFRPGQQSTIFPTAPAGLVFPGDSGMTASGYNTKYNDFGPRLGFAYSPGDSGKWSIRGGAGIYYNVPEEELTLQNLTAPPFSVASGGAGDFGGSPAYANPFSAIDASGAEANKFPFAPPAKGSAIDFTFFEPFSLSVLDPHFGVQSSYNYNLTLERQLPGQMIFSVAYVGLQGRHLENTVELNPAGQFPGTNPGCLAVKGCGPQTVAAKAPTTFRYNPNIFASVGQQSTDTDSNYNSLQISVNKHFSRGLQFEAAYSWSHSLDFGSSFENSQGLENPFARFRAYGDSAFDARNRFVFTYIYDIPSIRKFQGFEKIPSRLVDGWELSGGTTFQTGFPIRLSDSSRRSLTCPNSAFSFYGCWDVPNVLGSPEIANPRNFITSYYGKKTKPAPNYWFNPNNYAVETLGTVGNAGRNFFHAPGIDNTDLGLYKNIRIMSESNYVQLRFEFFNIFNHANFSAPISNANSVNFGRIFGVNSNYPSRIIQLAAKLYF